MGKFKKFSLKKSLLVLGMFITVASLFLFFREYINLKKVKANNNAFESLSKWENGWKLYSGQNTSMNIDASTNSVELSTDGTSPAFIRNNNLNEDFSQYTGIKLSLNVLKPKDIAKISIYVSNDTKFTNYAVAGINQNSMLVGENFLSVGKSGFTKYNNFNWNEPIKAVQIRFETVNNTPAKITINKLYSLTHNKGKIVFTMDDAWDSQYTVAYQLMKKYSFPGTIGVITSATGGTKLNIAQLEELQNNGFKIMGSILVANLLFTHMVIIQQKL
ncbi:hypothetical protein ACFVR2_06315 [Gottfriedia sp. NPDC057991]|uniref:hypothetical protein n=1 Tax=Gottfriedia sp. NPDC057991 TaxID=3346298 RepID=UPI0036DB82B7